jgi:hypothetical protein
MLHAPHNLPRPPIDLILIGASLLAAIVAGRAALADPASHAFWIDLLFLGAVLLFLVGMIRVIVRTFSIEHELEEMSAVPGHGRNETDAAAK